MGGEKRVGIGEEQVTAGTMLARLVGLILYMCGSVCVSNKILRHPDTSWPHPPQPILYVCGSGYVSNRILRHTDTSFSHTLPSRSDTCVVVAV